MASLSKVQDGPTVGVWGVADGATIGLVAQDGVGPYLCVYPKGKSFPALAIGVDRKGDAFLQLPGPDGTAKGYKTIKFNDLVAALERMADVGVVTNSSPPFAGELPGMV